MSNENEATEDKTINATAGRVDALVRLQCWAITTLEQEARGQYTSLGDGKNKKTIIAQKGDQTIILDEADIIEMRRAIAFFDMSIRKL